MSDDSAIQDVKSVQRSSRDTASLAGVLSGWLATKLPDGANPVVTIQSGVDANGMSSETIILTLDSTQEGQSVEERFVMRVAPSAADIPIFPSYRMDHQFELLQRVAELTDVPVPAVRWLEPSGELIGSPFFMMDFIAGDVPPDVMPYNLGGNWFAEASSAQQREMQDATVDLIAKLHQIPNSATEFAFLAADVGEQTALQRRFDEVMSWYEFMAADLGRSPLVERGLEWLRAHWPDEVDAAEPVLCWGDSRIGNVLYADYRPVSVLDWEIATLGPRELDVAWLIACHSVFEEIASRAGLPGLPDVLREDDVRAVYERSTGLVLGDFHWFYVLSCVMWGIFALRGFTRRIHFGEMERPADPDSLIFHAPLLKRLIGEEN